MPRQHERDSLTRAAGFLRVLHEMGGEIVIAGDPFERRITWVERPAGSSQREREERAATLVTWASPIYSSIIELLESPRCPDCGDVAPIEGALCDNCSPTHGIAGWARGATVSHAATAVLSILCNGQPAGDLYFEPPLARICLRCSKIRDERLAGPCVGRRIPPTSWVPRPWSAERDREDEGRNG